MFEGLGWWLEANEVGQYRDFYWGLSRDYYLNQLLHCLLATTEVWTHHAEIIQSKHPLQFHHNPSNMHVAHTKHKKLWQSTATTESKAAASQQSELECRDFRLASVKNRTTYNVLYPRNT